MIERPIIFNGDQIKSVLNGRKTQTRRIMTPQPDVCPDERGGHWWPANAVRSMVHVENEFMHPGWTDLAGDCCPYGKVGDRLWVRETFEYGLCTETTLAYKATHQPSDLAEGANDPIKWRPSIHMPRWVSRITLEITGIRVERLQAISEDDACAEGVDTAVYSSIWEKINGKGSWDLNSWVWVIEFKVLRS